MTTRAELQAILQHDLGKNYDPQRALQFLRVLEERHAGTPPAKKLEKLLETPPEEDTTLQVIYKTPFVLGEIVLAGKQTRRAHPLCAYHPIHFKKTYLQKLSRWETSPAHEARISKQVWNHFQEEDRASSVPLPLASTPSTFRSELMDAKTLGALSPINNSDDPNDLARQIVEAKAHHGAIRPLWDGLQSLLEETKALHSGGFLHHDLHRENLMLQNTPEGLRGCLIDFETTEEDDRFQTLSWKDACREDMRYLLEEASLILLCAGPNENLDKESELYQETLDFSLSSPKILATKKILKDNLNKALGVNRPLPQI